ncbi:MAG TPA: neocarzinostatin apoprotein domain-containing protein [Solirubrobacterales bacterium]|nr:neocarzinostatin apoprotein domain-containing protein [Solirubrobacterales bacterium]
MSSPLPKGLTGRIALIVALAALTIGLGATPAFAVTTVNATPDTELSDVEATKVTVTGSGYAASTQYRAGLCSAETYGLMGIPACSAFKTISSDASGNISTSLELEKENVNVHAGIPFPLNVGQPAEFTCQGEEGDVCEVVIATHGGSPSILAGEVVTFQ